MRASKKLSTVLVLLVALATAALVAGCGGGSGSGGGSDPATLAPKDAPVFVEGNLSPDAKEAENLNQLVNTVVGIEDIGSFVIEELEKTALGEGEKFSFEKEVEPWLGEKVGMYFSELRGEDLTGFAIALETTNASEAEGFIEEHVDQHKEKSEEAEFEGHKYWLTTDDATAFGMVGDYLVLGQGKAQFEEVVETSEAESLEESPKFTKAIEAAGEVGIGRVYVDIGGLIEKAGSQIPPETEAFFDLTGLEPQKATAVASMVPQAEAIELDLSTNVTQGVQSGDASAFLESLPATSVVGFASPEFGKSLGESLDELDKQGIPGQIEPGQLKPALEATGINLDSIAASLGDIGGFVEGSSKANLGGAMVIETKNATEARNTVSNIGLLLRASQTPGVTALSGNLTGFSVRSAELGEQPLIVGAAGEKLVIAYGSKAAAQALRGQARTLGDVPAFQAAKAALGSTPIGLFVAGGPTLGLVKSMLSPEQSAKFAEAEPYVSKITYVAGGEEAKGQTTTAKVIIGLSK